MLRQDETASRHDIALDNNHFITPAYTYGNVWTFKRGHLPNTPHLTLEVPTTTVTASRQTQLCCEPCIEHTINNLQF